MFSQKFNSKSGIAIKFDSKYLWNKSESGKIYFQICNISLEQYKEHECVCIFVGPIKIVIFLRQDNKIKKFMYKNVKSFRNEILDYARFKRLSQ